MIIAVNVQLKQLERRSLKKIRASTVFNGIRTRDLRNTGIAVGNLLR